MGINVYLQTIDGKKEGKVVDTNNNLAKLWPIGDSHFPLLQYIDPYGNVIFNGAQISEIKRELDLLIAQASQEQREVLEQVQDLATRCRDESHTFLRFRGD